VHPSPTFNLEELSDLVSDGVELCRGTVEIREEHGKVRGERRN